MVRVLEVEVGKKRWGWKKEFIEETPGEWEYQ